MPALRDSGRKAIDGAWDRGKERKRVKTQQPESYYSKIFAWREKDSNGDKSDYRFIHHFLDGDGNPGAPSIEACRIGIGVINGAMAGTTIPDKDKKPVYNHLAKHLKAAGIEPPTFKGSSNMSLSINGMTSFSSISPATSDFVEIGLRMVQRENQLLLSSLLPTSTKVSDSILNLGFIQASDLPNVTDALSELALTLAPIAGNSEDVVSIKDANDKLISYASRVGGSTVEELKKDIVHALHSITKLDTTFAGYMPVQAEITRDVENLYKAFREELVFDTLIVKSRDEVLQEYPLKNAKVSPYFIVKGFVGCDRYAIVKTDTSELIGCTENRSEADDEYERLIEGSVDKDTQLNSQLLELNLSAIDDKETLDVSIVITEDTEDDDENAEPVYVPEQDYEETPEVTHFSGPGVFANVETGDGRFIEPDALYWDSFPMPLMFSDESTEGHLGSRVCGSITNITRVEMAQDIESANANSAVAYILEGFFHDTPVGCTAAEMVRNGYLNGVSVDLDSAAGVVTESGSSVDDGPMRVIRKARIRGATLVPFPAFEQAKLYASCDDIAIAVDVAEDVAYSISSNPIDPTTVKFSILNSLKKIIENKKITVREALALRDLLETTNNDIYTAFSGDSLLAELENKLPESLSNKQEITVLTQLSKVA